MTNTPQDLRDVRTYLMARTGLPAVSLGIQHFSAQGGGYHEGDDLLRAAGRLTTDYSKRESPRDGNTRSDSASGIDIGDFNHEGKTLRDLTVALLAGLNAGDSRLHDIREVIYSLDRRTVQRWDRLHVRSSGDNSHLTHDHISFHRDSEGRRNRTDNFLGWLKDFFEGTRTDMSLLDTDIAFRYLAYRVHCEAYNTTRVTTPQGELVEHQGVAQRQTMAADLSAVKTSVAELVARPIPAVTMSAEDRARIVADLTAAMATIAQTAAENAVRKVLGGLNDATP